MSENATERLRKLLDDRGIEWSDRSPHPDERQYITDWSHGGFLLAAVETHDGKLELMSDYHCLITPEQIIDVTLAKIDQDSIQVLRSKVKLQGEYINELSSKYRDLFAENNAMATRHLGQMDYVRRKLKAAVLDSGKCQFELVEPQVSFSKPMRGDRFRCTNCGCVCARGFIADERLDHCPKCKREIFK